MRERLRRLAGEPRRRAATSALVIAVFLGVFASSIALAAGPPFPTPRPEGSVHDTARVLSETLEDSVAKTIAALADRSGVEVVVYTQVKPGADRPAEAKADARALREQWQVGGADGNGVVVLLEVDRRERPLQLAMIAGPGYQQRYATNAELSTYVAEELRPTLRTRPVEGSVISAVVHLATRSPRAEATPRATRPADGAGTPRPAPEVPAGPPYPPPVEGQTVYDHAGVFSQETIRSASETIARVEERSGAEVVVYTQVKPQSDTIEEAERDAIALIDQWGVGRLGFDDGLAILFDMDESLCHGQVQLYAAPGYRANYLTNQERQQIYEREMLPFLRECDLDEALLIALQRVEERATPEHAEQLQHARQLDAGVGLVGAPVLLFLLVGVAGLSWIRFGRDPVYLDDPSIYMPAPPPELTAAGATALYDGRAKRRALTTALLDLASRGELEFQEEDGLLTRRKVGIRLRNGAEDDPELLRARRRPLSEAERYLLRQLRALDTSARGDYIDPKELLALGRSVSTFDRHVEQHLVDKGWMRRRPSEVIGRWVAIGIAELVIAGIALFFALELPSQGLTLLAIALGVAGLATLVVSRAMPARTASGAMVFAMLAAYRRTLHATMEQARSMQDVVASRAVPWLETPDQAVVWGVALGLQKDVEDVLERSVEDLRESPTTATRAWVPGWYGSSGGSERSGGNAGGLFSSSPIPNVNGMIAALGSIGDSPGSSGSGSGGFSGGSSGGGGGGAGGGF